MSNKDVIIAKLQKLVEKQAKQIVDLTRQLDQVKIQLAKANKNSSNSSKSPSSDITGPAKKKGKGKPGRPKKRTIGGQPGRDRKLREPLPPERVDETIEYEIDSKEVERLSLTATDRFDTIQQIELPDCPVIITEHRFRLYESPDGYIYYPDVPEVQNQPIFGPRLLATIGWMKSCAHSSYTTIEQYFDDVLSVPVSRGYLSKLCTGIISDSLSDAYEETKAAIPQQAQLGSDETSFKNNGKKNWVWCISSVILTVFHIATNRSRAVLEELVGEEFKGYLNFDYFSANCSFAWNYDAKAQYCWAHLVREMKFLLKLPDKKTQVWAEKLLDRSRRLFSAWHRRDEMSQIGFERSMNLHRARFLEVMRKPPDTKEAANLAARFAVVDVTDGSTYDMSQDYFQFLFGDGVEPTNNHSEQQIRHVVIDRRITQGTRSAAGQRYHERMWTAIATCKKQDKNFFDFLNSSIKAKLTGLPAPSLLN